MDTRRQKASEGSNSEFPALAPRDRCADEIDSAFQEQVPVLVDALPAMGKSHGVVQWAAQTGNPLTVFTARYDLYDEYEARCKKFGLFPYRLPSFHRQCETANGTHGETWKRKVLSTYGTGLTPGDIHWRAGRLFDEELPCQQEGDCTYLTARDYDPDEYDVLIGHYKHAYVSDPVEDRYVALDEFPEDDFLRKFNADSVEVVVRTFLKEHEELPFEYLKDLREYRRDSARKWQGIEWLSQNYPDLKPDTDGVLEDSTGNAHVDGPAIANAVLTAQDLDNRWEYSQLPDGRRVVVNPGNGELTVLSRPPLSTATSIVGLDGTPTVEKWQLLLGPEMIHKQVLSDAERRTYLREFLDLKIIQTSTEAKPYSSKKERWLTRKKDLTLIDCIGFRENQLPTLISSRAAIKKYKQHGLDEFVADTEYYGNLKGSNKFRDVEVGIVLGSPHKGDEHMEKWGALMGESVERDEDTYGMNQDYGPLGNRILHGIRENEVLQAVMRFSRDRSGATVYVHTAALPAWVQPEMGVTDPPGNIQNVYTWPDGMKRMVAAIKSLGLEEWTLEQVEQVDGVDLSYQMILRHHRRLEAYGYIKGRKPKRSILWRDIRLRRMASRGHVEWAK